MHGSFVGDRLEREIFGDDDDENENTGRWYPHETGEIRIDIIGTLSRDRTIDISAYHVYHEWHKEFVFLSSILNEVLSANFFFVFYTNIRQYQWDVTHLRCREKILASIHQNESHC